MYLVLGAFCVLGMSRSGGTVYLYASQAVQAGLYIVMSCTCAVRAYSYSCKRRVRITDEAMYEGIKTMNSVPSGNVTEVSMIATGNLTRC